MIKSDLMNRKIIWVFLLFVLLSGCGQRRQPDVEYFQGDVVATLQKPVNQPPPEFVDTALPPIEDPIVTPEASQTIPTNTPGATPTPTKSNLQTNIYPVETGTTTLVPEPSATTNLTQTPTPVLGVPAWDGVWNIWYQAASGGYTPAQLTVSVSGTRLTGSAKIGGTDFSFKGDIISEGTQVEGEWETPTDDGTFWWRMNSPEIFVGSRESRFGFCGNRATAQPNPCREIP
jgi:hypothetical protein